MSLIHMRQISGSLERLFSGKIDLSDYDRKREEEKRNAFLTRSLAAYAIYYHSECTIDEAALSVTDGFDDNGIDAIRYDPATNRIWIVQSKWINNGTGSVSLGDIQKFLAGIRDLLNEKWDRFNSKVKSKKDEITSAIENFSIRFNLVITFTGSNLEVHQMRAISDLLDELNSPSETAIPVVFPLEKIHKAIATLSQGESINFELALSQWGFIETPKLSYYGYANCKDVAEIFGRFEQRLFHKNIRNFLGVTSVNRVIQESVSSAPQDFFYLNNGITLVCKTVKKRAAADNTIGIFSLEGAHVVNGAQTVGVLANQATYSGPESLSLARVLTKIVSLEGASDNFDVEVTRATNTQNRIEKMDFVSLDKKQERIRTELYLENISYTYKSGDSQGATSTSTHLREAVIALACRHPNIDYAILAKKEIGTLWNDINSSPYTDLFPETISGPEVWRAIQILRVIEETLKPRQTRSIPNPKRGVAVYGNTIVSHIVFSQIPVEQISTPLCPLDNTLIISKASQAYEKMVEVVMESYSDAILGRLFYNFSKTKDIVQKAKIKIGI